MDYIRTYNDSHSWDSEFLTSMFTRLGSALTADDILSLPADLFKERLDLKFGPRQAASSEEYPSDLKTSSHHENMLI